MQQSKYIIIDSILLFEIDVEAVPEHLSACIIYQVLWDKNNKCVFAVATSSE
jgi:hypothetical protein